MEIVTAVIAKAFQEPWRKQNRRHHCAKRCAGKLSHDESRYVVDGNSGEGRGEPARERDCARRLTRTVVVPNAHMGRPRITDSAIAAPMDAATAPKR